MPRHAAASRLALLLLVVAPDLAKGCTRDYDSNTEEGGNRNNPDDFTMCDDTCCRAVRRPSGLHCQYALLDSLCARRATGKSATTPRTRRS